MKTSNPRPWLVLGLALALAFGGSCLWSQDREAPAPAAPTAEVVSEEEANAAALELANSLASGDGGESGNEEATEETPPEREPESAPGPISAPKPGNSGTPGPQPVNDDDFRALRASSPFTRSLNLSDSLILTGIAQIGDETIATVIDKTSKESYVVSSEANAQGWRMLEVEGDQSDLQKITAKIVVAGGEIVSVRFDENQLKRGETKPAPGSGMGRGSGGKRMGGPPSEIREKLGKLSEDQRRKLFDKLRQIREKNPELTREQMGEKISAMADEMLQKGGR